jgi:RNA polymerase sigma-70 factor, ECF subfamily
MARVSEVSTVDRASEEAFRARFERHRRAITLHCYRMLGSLQEAEEVVQETLLRAWQREGEVRSPGATRAWLYQIATNASLDLLRARRRRALPHLVALPASVATRLGPPADEHLWVEPAPDALLDVADNAAHGPEARVSLRESVSLAFITALQFLSPRQRAALLLVDVLGWGPQEAADLLETSVFSVNSLLQRARRSVEARRGDSEPAEAPSSADAALLRRYIAMWESGDLDAFTALLADDARLSMPPQPEWFAGRDAVRGFLAQMLAGEPRQYRFVPLGANGQPALAVYARPLMGNAAYQPAGITVFSIRGGRVAEMTRFTSPELFPMFGLPPHFPSGGPDAQPGGL